MTGAEYLPIVLAFGFGYLHMTEAHLYFHVLFYIVSVLQTFHPIVYNIVSVINFEWLVSIIIKI
jgi:hypothetical protein